MIRESAEAVVLADAGPAKGVDELARAGSRGWSTRVKWAAVASAVLLVIVGLLLSSVIVGWPLGKQSAVRQTGTLTGTVARAVVPPPSGVPGLSSPTYIIGMTGAAIRITSTDGTIKTTTRATGSLASYRVREPVGTYRASVTCPISGQTLSVEVIVKRNATATAPILLCRAL